MSEKKFDLNGHPLNFAEALGLLFIFFKITGVITWSWWFVLMPLYLPAVIGLVLGGLILVWAWFWTK